MTLKSFLEKQISTHGPMDIGQFMALALGHPEFGYYMKKDPFGAEGDFTTAPEISQMFGEVIGAWTADAWTKMGRPPRFTLLECGPGRGTLMADILRAGKGVPGFLDSAQVHFLEVSPVLKVEQAKNVPGAQWHETLESVPQDQPVIVIANEFLDALPVRQLQKTKNGWAERAVDFRDGRFEFALVPVAPPFIPPQAGGVLGNIPPRVRGGRGGAEEVVEISSARESFIKNLCALMKRAGGAALVIDYGHVKTAPGDTLQALYKHKFVSPLEHIGDADITAHVDFEALAKAADAEIFGPVEQGAFLKALGIETRAAYLISKADQKQKADIENALKRLTGSDQMGALFKVMGFSFNHVPLAGF